MQVKLVVANGKQAGKEIPVTGPKFLIGRGEGCQLRPQSTEVSRKHCVILVEEGAATIEDCGSTNATFVNDQKITGRRPLKDGDRIRVGMLGLQVRLTVDVGGEKKPKARNVQEAAARTAASPPASSDDLDISGWLAGDGAVEVAVPREQLATAGDTLMGKSLVDTTTIPAPHLEKKKEEEKKKGTPAKGAGKLHHPPPKPTAADSGTAADDALRHLLHRRKV